MKQNNEILTTSLESNSSVSRRKFFSIAGIGLLATSALASCNKDEEKNKDSLDLGSGDTGLFNYLFLLEHVQATFYAKVATGFYSGILDAERKMLGDIWLHQTAHREFWRTVIGKEVIIPDLEIDFTGVDFSNRESTLNFARFIEDTSVAAYNGIIHLIKNLDYMLTASKMVSVEARHAAYIRDLVQNGTFSDSSISVNGMEQSRTPDQVIAAIQPYLKTKVLVFNLPNA